MSKKYTTMANQREASRQDWINVKEQPPTEIGWYKIKTHYGEFEAPVSTNVNGKLVWVIPDEGIITHYKPKEDGQTNKTK